MEQVKAFFIDKDGTIVDESGYPEKIPADDVMYKEVIRGLKRINEKGYKIFIVSNQPWIAKKRLSFFETNRIFRNVINKLEEFNIQIEGYVYCPHKTSDFCECKKPKPKLVLQLIERYDIDLKNSYVVGDMDSDILMGKKIGLKTVLVRTGCGRDYEDIGADFVIDNLNGVEEII